MTQTVQEHFPDRHAEIVALYLHSPEFRGLCHDFGVCVEQIRLLNESTDLASESKNQRLEQFRELQDELEAEIIEQLSVFLAKSGPVSEDRKERHVRNDSEPT